LNDHALGFVEGFGEGHFLLLFLRLLGHDNSWQWVSGEAGVKPHARCETHRRVKMGSLVRVGRSFWSNKLQERNPSRRLTLRSRRGCMSSVMRWKFAASAFLLFIGVIVHARDERWQKLAPYFS